MNFILPDISKFVRRLFGLLIDGKPTTSAQRIPKPPSGNNSGHPTIQFKAPVCPIYRVNPGPAARRVEKCKTIISKLQKETSTEEKRKLWLLLLRHIKRGSFSKSGIRQQRPLSTRERRPKASQSLPLQLSCERIQVGETQSLANQSQLTSVQMVGQNVSADKATFSEPRLSIEDNGPLDLSYSGSGQSTEYQGPSAFSAPMTSINDSDHSPPDVPSPGSNQSIQYHGSPIYSVHVTRTNGWDSRPPNVSLPGSSQTTQYHGSTVFSAPVTNLNGWDSRPPDVSLPGSSQTTQYHGSTVFSAPVTNLNGWDSRPPDVSLPGSSQTTQYHGSTVFSAPVTNLNGWDSRPPDVSLPGSSLSTQYHGSPYLSAPGTSSISWDRRPPNVSLLVSSRGYEHLGLQFSLPVTSQSVDPPVYHPAETSLSNNGLQVPNLQSSGLITAPSRVIKKQSKTPSCRKRSKLGGGELPSSMDIECPICMEDLKSTNVVFLDCVHAFHKSCMKKWLKKERSCPVCRTEVLTI